MHKATVKTAIILVIATWIANPLIAQIVYPPETFCNPLNLSYLFMFDANSARQAADPTIVLFQDDYYLFASRSDGYWYSNDLREWTLVIPTGLPLDEYAPTAFAIGDTLYFAAWPFGSATQIYSCTDPKNGTWQEAADFQSEYRDPCLFLDDDGKVYMYQGCRNVEPFLSVVELDPKNNFQEIGSSVPTIDAHADLHGWERRGDDNLLDEEPWIEGCWMTKYKGKYYLQYSGPGTEYKTYADGVYTSDHPLGPFVYESYSPFSFKPTGFIGGAGHGSTFLDKSGNYWRVTTMVISIKHMFERRIGMFPVDFDADSVIHTNTVFGDYPQYMPGVKENPISDNFTGWMLLSHKKFASVSSVLEGYGIENAVDEDVKTYWCAQTGDSGEYIILDLGKTCEIRALQINFGEHDTDTKLVRGRENPVYQQYLIHTSIDSIGWSLLIDKSNNKKDVPHDYIQLSQLVDARYVKLTNLFTPGEGKFCVRDLRVFGNPRNAKFTLVSNVTVTRDTEDDRNVLIRWESVENSDGYIVRYGIEPEKLYNHYMVYDADSVSIHSLNKGVEYYFSVEAFDSGTDYYEGEYYLGIQEMMNTIPGGYSLSQNYPNPFNSSTLISYKILKKSRIKISIYDNLGRMVEVLLDQVQNEGEYHINWNAENLCSGIYFYRIDTGEYSSVKKCLFVK